MNAKIKIPIKKIIDIKLENHLVTNSHAHKYIGKIYEKKFNLVGQLGFVFILDSSLSM